MGYQSVMIGGPFSSGNTSVQPTCTNSDGSITVWAAGTTGPYSYQWSNGVNILNSPDSICTLSNIAAGPYTVTITDGNGCFATGGYQSPTSGESQIWLWASSPVTATSSATPSNCFDGTATVVPANGTAPYSYSWNTIPIQTSATASGLSPGFYQCTVSDANGCTRLVYVNVPSGPNYLQATSSVLPAVCGGSDGSILLNVSGGQAPYSFSWSHGATTEDVLNLPSGMYQVTITDAQGCSLQLSKYVSLHSPVQLVVSETAPGCGLSDGSMNVLASGGTPPYSYMWSNGETTAQISGLPEGGYSVLVSDQNGCTAQRWEFLEEPLSCLARISGKVVNDVNGNCNQDPGEGVISGVNLHAAPGWFYATTNANGNYSMYVEPGNTYTLEAYVPQHWTQVCPDPSLTTQVNATAAGWNYTNNDFYLQPDSVFNNVKVTVNSGFARPGFPVTWYVSLQNLGTTSVAPAMQFSHSANCNFSSASVAGTYQAASRTFSWNAPVLAPQAQQVVYLYGAMPVNATLGDVITLTASATLAGADVDPGNNTDTTTRIISGSYDPNDKQVSPAGWGEEGFIAYEDTTDFLYTIRFQNSGTDTAFTVVIRDMIDTDLDLSTFRLEAFSHPVTVELENDRMLQFRFNQIMLPDSHVNEPRSHGLVQYRIRRYPDLPFGTEILNTASIYFDYNAPIVTNTARNTIFGETVHTLNAAIAEARLVPNPSKGNALVQLRVAKADVWTCTVYDVQGRKVQQSKNALAEGLQSIPLTRPEFEGVYLVVLESETARITQRWVVMP
jgi:hypothetical protein